MAETVRAFRITIANLPKRLQPNLIGLIRSDRLIHAGCCGQLGEPALPGNNLLIIAGRFFLRMADILTLEQVNDFFGNVGGVIADAFQCFGDKD
jgi:hypothetical protein